MQDYEDTMTNNEQLSEALVESKVKQKGIEEIINLIPLLLDKDETLKSIARDCELTIYGSKPSTNTTAFLTNKRIIIAKIKNNKIVQDIISLPLKNIEQAGVVESLLSAKIELATQNDFIDISSFEKANMQAFAKNLIQLTSEKSNNLSVSTNKKNHNQLIGLITALLVFFVWILWDNDELDNVENVVVETTYPYTIENPSLTMKNVSMPVRNHYKSSGWSSVNVDELKLHLKVYPSLPIDLFMNQTDIRLAIKMISYSGKEISGLADFSVWSSTDLTMYDLHLDSPHLVGN